MSTVKHYVESFMENYVKLNNRPSEIAKKEGILRNHIVPFFGGMEVSAIQLPVIRKYQKAKKDAGYSHKSIRNQIIVLSTLLHYVHEELLELDRLPSIKHLECVKPQTSYFTAEDIEKMVEVAEEPFRTMIVVAAMTGMRIGELRALRWSDVDLKKGTIVVARSDWMGHEGPPKGGETLSVALNAHAAEALKQLRSSGSHLVFGCPPHGTMYTYRTCWSAMKRIRKAAGVREGQWHRLRHAFATHLMLANQEAFAVKNAMRHSSLEVTDRYVHLKGRKAVETVDALVPAFKFKKRFPYK